MTVNSVDLLSNEIYLNDKTYYDMSLFEFDLSLKLLLKISFIVTYLNYFAYETILFKRLTTKQQNTTS